jgi:hypothetical protein
MYKGFASYIFLYSFIIHWVLVWKNLSLSLSCTCACVFVCVCVAVIMLTFYGHHGLLAILSLF